MSITELAIKRPSLIVVLFASLGFFGWIAYNSLNYELMPKMEFPIMTISAIYPGASPSEVENSVVKKIEEAVSDVAGLKTVRGNSQENIGLIIMELNKDADFAESLQSAQRKVNQIIPLLPKNCKAPVVNKFGFNELPVFQMGVSSSLNPNDFFDLAKNKIKPALAGIKGVAQIDLIGGEERMVRVMVKKDELAKYHLSILQVVQAVGINNLDFPTGKLKNDQTEVSLRLAGKYQSIAELQNIVIFRAPYTNTEIRLNQVADVTYSTRDVDKVSRINGINAIGMVVRKQSDANAVNVSKAVREEIAKLEKEFVKDKLKFGIASDTSDFTLQAADAVTHDLMLAIFLVALVMLLFLHSLRSSLIVMLAIPASLVTTFIGMYILGFTLNLMTLLALSLVIGILVDDSIVVLENIYRHLEMGTERRAAALIGRNEIGFTALSITLVDVVVFLPLTMVSGIVSDLLRQFSLVVVMATLCSLFVSFTVTPLLASRFASVIHLSDKNLFGWLVLKFEAFLAWITSEYLVLLRWAIRSVWTRGTVLLLTVGALFASFGLVIYGYIGAEFVNPGDRGEFIIKLELPKSATLAQTNVIVQGVEKYLFANKNVENVFSTVGSTSDMLGSSQAANKADIQIKLVPANQRGLHTEIISKRTNDTLTQLFPSVKFSAKPVSIMGGADQEPIQVVINGTNLDTVLSVANVWRDSVAKVAGIVDPELSIKAGSPEVNIRINKDKMSELGLTMESVGATLQTAYTGNTDSKYRDGNNEYDINVQLDAFDRRNKGNVEDLSFVNNKGSVIMLRQFADVIQGTGPSRLERSNRQPSVTIKAGILGRPSGSIGADIEKFIKRQTISPSVQWAWEGDMKNQQESFGQMGIALIASILLVYLIMIALYDSYVYPFVVLFSIPVAVVGAFLALALTMQALSIFSMIGMIMLIGLVAKNAILLVDFANQQKAEGMEVAAALIESGKTRMRPILMTTLSMIIGMLPIALAKGAGAEWKNGLAWALVGGLTSSMFLTLLVVPVMYRVVDAWKERFGRWFGDKEVVVEV